MLSHLTGGLLSLAFGLLLAGCQSGGAQIATSDEMPADAVRCDKCQVTWVRMPTTPRTKGGTVAYRSIRQMECPDCRDAVSNFFATGNLRHECKACGANMAICEAH